MQKLFLIFILLVSKVIFVSTSYAEWTPMGETTSGSSYFLNFNTIKEHNGYIYWWDMVSYLKPNKYGTFSSQTYYMGDCNIFRFKILSDKNFKGQNGTGSFEIYNVPDKEWRYPSPNSMGEYIFKIVCNK